MNQEPRSMAPGDRPRLASGVRMSADPVTGQPILLYPEGMVGLNPTGAAILRRCDGKRTLDEIALELQSEFAAPLEVVREDAKRYLEELRDHQMIQVLGTGGEA